MHLLVSLNKIFKIKKKGNSQFMWNERSQDYMFW
jgi:hypothetical protein